MSSEELAAFITAIEKGMGKHACQSPELEALLAWLKSEEESIVGSPDAASGTAAAAAQEGGGGGRGGGGEPLPEEFERVRQPNYDLCVRNLDGDVSCDGETFSLMKSQDGVKVYSAAVPGHTIRRWRIEMCIHNATPVQIDYLLMDGPARLSWSPGLSEMRTLKTYEDGTFVSMFRSLPVAGGMISAREFCEVRYRLMKDDGTLLNWAEGLQSTPLLPVSDGLVRAYALKGSGYRLVPRGTSVDFTMTFMTDIGGQIPIWLLNSSMATTSIQEMNALRGAISRGLGTNAPMPTCKGVTTATSASAAAANDDDDGNTASKPGPGSDDDEYAPRQECPESYAATLARAKDQYYASLADATSSDGEAWVLEKETDGIRVFSAKIPNQKIKRWKVVGEIQSGSPEKLWRLIGDYQYRLKWDAALRMGKTIARYEQGVDAVYYQVNEAAGGWISPRDFVDIRQTRACTVNGHPGLETWCCSLDPAKGALLSPAEGGFVRAENAPGGGFKVVATSATSCEITMLAVTDIKGSLPVSIINAAMSSTFVSMVQGMRTCIATGKVDPPSSPLELLGGGGGGGGGALSSSSRKSNPNHERGRGGGGGGRAKALASSLSSPSAAKKKSLSIFHSAANPSTLDGILKKHDLLPSSLTTGDFPLLVAAGSRTEDDKAVVACVRELLLAGVCVPSAQPLLTSPHLARNPITPSSFHSTLLTLLRPPLPYSALLRPPPPSSTLLHPPHSSSFAFRTFLTPLTPHSLTRILTP